MSKRRKRVPLTLELINKVISLEVELKKRDEEHNIQICRLCNTIDDIRRAGKSLFMRVGDLEDGK